MGLAREGSADPTARPGSPPTKRGHLRTSAAGSPHASCRGLSCVEPSRKPRASATAPREPRPHGAALSSAALGKERVDVSVTNERCVAQRRARRQDGQRAGRARAPAPDRRRTRQVQKDVALSIVTGPCKKKCAVQSACRRQPPARNHGAIPVISGVGEVRAVARNVLGCSHTGRACAQIWALAPRIRLPTPSTSIAAGLGHDRTGNAECVLCDGLAVIALALPPPRAIRPTGSPAAGRRGQEDEEDAWTNCDPVAAARGVGAERLRATGPRFQR